ncbi:pseudouridine-5'-phosphatase-like, partial [Drosophila guanche]|uniref:pseudouridine-5'-phosphatase-like n=1 Tax=Drosophila guanche TaxID=7266 RepID=UPI00147176EA
MDGLILDTETYYTKAFENICNSYGKDFTWEDKLKVMGKPMVEVAQKFVEEKNLPLSGQEFRYHLDEECEKIFNQPIPLLPGAARLIEHLHQHDIPIALATS